MESEQGEEAKVDWEGGSVGVEGLERERGGLAVVHARAREGISILSTMSP